MHLVRRFSGPDHPYNGLSTCVAFLLFSLTNSSEDGGKHFRAPTGPEVATLDTPCSHVPPENDGSKQDVVVTKNTGTTEEVVLDPENIPEVIRDRIGRHKAYTRNVYSLRWEASSRLESTERDGDDLVVTVSITQWNVTLGLATTFYLPSGVSKKLRDHEIGHRRIAEVMYESADSEARRIAEQMIGRSFTGRSASPEEAGEAAVQVAGKELIASYLSAVQAEAQRIQDLYDEITAHGSDARVTEDEAITRAFEQRKKQKAEPKK